MRTATKKAHTLVEALPYIQKYHDKIVVIKYGGNAMTDNKLRKSVLRDIALLRYVGMKPVIVHGGGPFITKEVEKRGVKPKFIDGLRVTDSSTIKIVKDIFRKKNREIAGIIRDNSCSAKSLMGNKGVIQVRQKDSRLGLVGEITKVDSRRIKEVLKKGMIPVISPLGKGKDCRTYNINADTAATAVAIALKAEKLTILTNVRGVMEGKKFISHLSIKEAESKIDNGVISSGMIPKVKACIHAVKKGCPKAHLIDGTIPHSLFFEIFTDRGVGTEIVR